LREELKEHLEEAVEANLAEGMAAEEAVSKAIEEFGEPGMVREGLQGIYGQRLISVLMERAMEWKESTIKSGWKWSFVAHFTLAVTILAQLALLLFLLVYVVPTVTGNFEMQGLSIPDHMQLIINLADFVLNHPLIVITAVVLGLYLFEWKYRGENKPTIRLALGSVVSLTLVLAVGATSVTSIVSFIGTLHLLHQPREETVVSKFKQADEAFSQLERAIDGKRWSEARDAVLIIQEVFSRFQYDGPMVPTLLAVRKQHEIDEVRSIAGDIARFCNIVTYWEGSEKLSKLREAYTRFKKIVVAVPNPEEELSPSGNG
jgi:hypothetical protein